MRPVVPIAIASIILAVSAGCRAPDRLRFTRTETRTIELKQGGQLYATTFNGAISVEGWERDEVSIIAQIRERREGDVRFNVESKDGRVEITAEQNNPRKVVIGFNFVSSGVSYTLKIPRKTATTLIVSNGRIEMSQIDDEIDASTSNGSIAINEIGGAAKLTTKNGSISAKSVKGDLLARTSNGGFDVKDIKGSADLRTTNGRIEVRGVSGRLEAVTSNGPIIAENITGNAELGTTNGRVEARDIKGNTDINTSNGAIIAENLENDLTGRSSNGRIDIQRVFGGIEATTSNSSIKAVDLNGKGRGISLTTTNASIEVTLGQAQGALEASAVGGHRSVIIETPNVQPTTDGSVIRTRIGNSDQPIVLKTTNSRITVR